jgi:hypothetical protein
MTDFGPFLSGEQRAADQRRRRREHLLRLELAKQPVIDGEFREIAEGFEVTPRRQPWPLRLVVGIFHRLDYMRRTL